jgi:hypothetical protein
VAQVGEILGQGAELEYELEGGGGVIVGGEPAHDRDQPGHGS